MKRTHQPSVVRRKRTHGFLARLRAKAQAVALNGSPARLGTSFAKSIGEAAATQLKAGHPIYCYDERYPEGVVRKYPDGRRELVRMCGGKVDVIRAL